MALGGLAVVSAVKLDAALSAYLAAMKATGAAKQTVGTARRDIEAFRRFLRVSKREEMDLAALSSVVMREYLRFLRTYPALRTNRPLGRRAAVERFGRFRHFLRFLHTEGVTRRDLSLGAGYYTLDLTESKCLSVAEAAAFMAGPDVSMPVGIRDRAILELIYGCALRWREVVALECGDVDRGAGLLRIREGDRGAMKRAEWATSTLPRLIPIPSEALVWLGRYLAEVRPRIVEEKLGQSDAVFLGFGSGRPLSRGAVWARVEQGRKNSTVAGDAACANLRDSLIHHLIIAGVDETALWWFAGFASLPEGANARIFGRAVLARHPRHAAPKSAAHPERPAEGGTVDASPEQSRRG